MGKLEFVKHHLHEVTGGAGFSAEPPTASMRACTLRYIIREAQLQMNAWLTGQNAPKTEWALVERVRATVARDIAPYEELMEYALVFDNHKDVTVAKVLEREARDEQLQQQRAGAAAADKEPYADAECDAFYVSDTLGDQKRMSEAKLPDFARLRLTKGSHKNRCMTRMMDVIVWAAATGSYECKNFEFSVVRDNVLSTYSMPQNAASAALQSNTTLPTPDGVHEAEFLCLWLASRRLAEVANMGDEFSMGELGILIYCSDTDIVPASMACVERILIPNRMQDPASTPKLWIDTTPANVMSKKRKVAAAKKAGETDNENNNNHSDAGNDDEQNGGGGGEQLQLVDSSNVPYVYNMIEVYAAFLVHTAKGNTCWSAFEEPLAALIFLACLGGTDKVERMRKCTAEAIFNKYAQEKTRGQNSISTKEVRDALRADFVRTDELDIETPVEERLAKRRRVNLNEEAAMDFFLRAVAASNFTKLYEYVWKTLSTTKKVTDEVVQHMLTLMCDYEQANYDKKVSEYPQVLAAAKEKLDAWNAEQNGDKPKVGDRKRKKKPPMPQEPDRQFRPPETVAELRAKVRRTHWQLIEFLNATVANGTPDCAQLSSIKDTQNNQHSVWGWTIAGALDNDVQRFDTSKTGAPVLL